LIQERDYFQNIKEKINRKKKDKIKVEILIEKKRTKKYTHANFSLKTYLYLFEFYTKFPLLQFSMGGYI
jgi:hypothetical protein